MNRDNSANQDERFQDAQAMCTQGQPDRRRDAAVIAEVALSTFTHRMASQGSAEGYGKTRQLLTVEEESIFLWRCDILQCSGWPQGKITELVTELSKYSEGPAVCKLPAKWHMPL